ncbi:MAG: DUF4837 family protein [Bacteroidales bacterium]|nr:DUF4837 family protein [Bacteroidales bacterium]
MKKRNFINLLLIIAFIIFLFQSCTTDKPNVPKSSGKTAEIIVVSNNKTQWETKIGETIREFFCQEEIMLPQPESMFSLAYVPLTNFNNTKMFKYHHNIFIVDINNKFTEPLLEIEENLWSQPQRVIKITAPDDSSFIKIFNENKEIFLKLFLQSERKRLINLFRAFKDLSIENKIKEKFNISLSMPGGFYIAKETKNFIWLRKEPQKFSQGIIIYSYDYTDTIAFNENRIIAYRDSLTKEYIPGPTLNTYMLVSKEVIPPVYKKINFNDNFSIETRGLWMIHGDFMGGPFINYTLVDEKKNKVITLDGYVYAPNSDKRDLLLQLESIFYSLKFTE